MIPLCSDVQGSPSQRLLELHQPSQISLSSSHQLTTDPNPAHGQDLSSNEIESFNPEGPVQVSSRWRCNLDHPSSPCPRSTTNCTTIIAFQLYIFISASGFPNTSSSIWALPQFAFEANAKLPPSTNHPSYAPTLRQTTTDRVPKR